jgi:Fe2+ transport system protein FeoA
VDCLSNRKTIAATTKKVYIMTIPLSHAPFDRPLILKDITEPELEALLSRLGLFRGHAFVREEEEVLVHPVRVRGPKGEAVLGGGMAMRVIVHLDDGRRMPLTDMAAGQRGHIEGTTCSANLSDALDTLGLHENEEIVYLRQLPPMDYTVLVNRDVKQRIQEGMAAKIWGRIGDRHLQFVTAGKGQPFFIEKILGGAQSTNALHEKGIVQGRTIALDSVAPAQIFNMAAHAPIVISTNDGLHLHLRMRQAEHMLVLLAKK